MTHIPLLPTVLQFPVLSMQLPDGERLNPVAHPVQGAALFLQFMVPTHLSFWRTVPKAQVVQMLSSEGSVAMHGEPFLRQFPLLSRLKVGWQTKH